MRRVFALLFPLALAACAVNNGEERRAYLTSLVGAPETELVRQLGVPTRSYETTGRKFVAYDERRVDVVPAGPFFGGFGYGHGYGGYGGFGGFGSGFGYAFPPQVVERGCETTFEIDGGRVQSWALRGNACG